METAYLQASVPFSPLRHANVDVDYPCRECRGSFKSVADLADHIMVDHWWD